MKKTMIVLTLVMGLAPLAARAADSAPDANAVPGRLSLGVALSDWDAQQKVRQFVGSQQAHRDAIVSLQQCRSCHDGNAALGWLDKVTGAWQPQGPWIGVSVAPADGVLRSQLRLPEGTGVVVTQVVPNGPAQQAGVEPDDVLVSVDGKPVASGEDLDRIIQSASGEGGTLKLKLVHAGESVEREVEPRRADQAVLNLITSPHPVYRIGVEVNEPDQTLRRQLKLGDGGLVVAEVQGGKPADAAGVKSGDVLLSANGKRLKAQDELTAEIQRAAESPVELELVRGGVALKITVTPTKEQAAAEQLYLNMLNAVQYQPRELMLVHAGDAKLLADQETKDLDQLVARLATTQPAATQPPAERLAQIADEVERLRQAVDALRKDLDQRRESKDDDGKNTGK